MSRHRVSFILLAAVVCVVAWRADALAADADPRKPRAGEPSVQVVEEKSEKRKKCEALNECRRKFTVCYNEIHSNPKKDWETHENECALPYSDCIKENFRTFEMWFTRMFNPTVLNCEKY